MRKREQLLFDDKCQKVLDLEVFEVSCAILDTSTVIVNKELSPLPLNNLDYILL